MKPFSDDGSTPITAEDRDAFVPEVAAGLKEGADPADIDAITSLCGEYASGMIDGRLGPNGLCDVHFLTDMQLNHHAGVDDSHSSRPRCSSSGTVFRSVFLLT